ncbi:MAG: hypothetical protein JXR83_05165 [Deltaproteobacteria bacterium]|nr:hypothetical protein [Deltaproteobacteria bacterium]
MIILIGLLIAACAVALVSFGLSGLKLQNLLVTVPKERLKETGLNLDMIALNMLPNYLTKMKKLGHPAIEQLARRMQIEMSVFFGIFFVLLLYAIVVS